MTAAARSTAATMSTARRRDQRPVPFATRVPVVGEGTVAAATAGSTLASVAESQETFDAMDMRLGPS